MMNMSSQGGGHLYMQTNEIRNCVVHYRRAADGAITEMERTATGGAGSGTFKPISGQESAPNAFEGADQRHDAAGKLTPRMERYTANTHGETDRVPTMAVLSPDRKFLIVGTTSSSEQPASQQRSTMAGRLDGVSGR
jgi:hypothetical protein